MIVHPGTTLPPAFPSLSLISPEPTPDAEGDHDLDAESMAFTSHTLFTTSTAPLLEEYKKVSTAQRGISSSRSISRDINSVPPMCIQMTRKYFDVTFGCSSREPGAYLEENGTSQWQPIKPKKGSLLKCVTDKIRTISPLIPCQRGGKEIHVSEQDLRRK